VSHTILLVDDEYAALEMLAFLLANEGYQIATASDGAEALLRVREKRPDLIITDYWMPKMNGLELCARLRQEEAWRTIPVLLMTAAYDLELPPLDELAGVLPKPIRFVPMLETIRKVLGSSPR
jgi:CheY-like chemotaxis protein